MSLRSQITQNQSLLREAELITLNPENYSQEDLEAAMFKLLYVIAQCLNILADSLNIIEARGREKS